VQKQALISKSAAVSIEKKFEKYFQLHSRQRFAARQSIAGLRLEPASF
jgi:hypothetical protein